MNMSYCFLYISLYVFISFIFLIWSNDYSLSVIILSYPFYSIPSHPMPSHPLIIPVFETLHCSPSYLNFPNRNCTVSHSGTCSRVNKRRNIFTLKPLPSLHLSLPPCTTRITSLCLAVVGVTWAFCNGPLR